jgi:uncharacterized protein with ParB-like and HNH nuclease domain
MERWNINRTQYKVSDFISWQRSGTLELSPSFQRRPVWSSSYKSYLIDTIVRGLPIPIIFIREQTDLNTFEPKRQIVDGQQRIRTLLAYVCPETLRDRKDTDSFTVKKNHNPELFNKKFIELDRKIQQNILDYPFSVHVLPADVDDKQVLQIFARMNATGVKLNHQELRNAKYTGIFKQTMYELAYEQLKRWRDWKIFSENNIARMDEVELTSDLVMVMICKDIASKTQSVIDGLYNKYEDKFNEQKIIMERFQNVMDSIDREFGTELPHLEFRRKTLFYSLFVLVYDYHYSLDSELTKCIKKPLPKNFTDTISKINHLFAEKSIPEAVAEAVTTRTSTVTSRKKVFNYLKSKCIRG